MKTAHRLVSWATTLCLSCIGAGAVHATTVSMYLDPFGVYIFEGSGTWRFKVEFVDRDRATLIDGVYGDNAAGLPGIGLAGEVTVQARFEYFAEEGFEGGAQFLDLPQPNGIMPSAFPSLLIHAAFPVSPGNCYFLSIDLCRDIDQVKWSGGIDIYTASPLLGFPPAPGSPHGSFSFSDWHLDGFFSLTSTANRNNYAILPFTARGEFIGGHTTVPLPAPAALLITAIGGLGIVARRRRAKALTQA